MCFAPGLELGCSLCITNGAVNDIESNAETIKSGNNDHAPLPPLHWTTTPSESGLRR